MLAGSFIDNLALRVSNWTLEGVGGRMHDKAFLEKEIAKWKTSPNRLLQIKGHLYYDNEHDILRRSRTMIGDNGELQPVDNLPNNRIIDNQYGKLVNQKVNYLLGQPFVIEAENERYGELLKGIFGKRFMRTLKNAGKAMLNSGIAWLYPYYNERGEFDFKFFPGYEILPFWKDTDHSELDYAVRLYVVAGYEGSEHKLIQKVEVYDLDGVHNFILDGGTLIPDIVNYSNPDSYYVTLRDDKGAFTGFNWDRVPLIPLSKH